jgi:nucleotide-binding universal stress UspA family protein
MRKRILHPTDFSPGAEAAFTRALEAARREHGELVLVHVLEGRMPPRRGPYAASELPVRAAVEAAVRQGLDRLRARAKRAGVPASDMVAEGWVPEQIAKLAKKRHADLIVMGTHGRTGWRKVTLGSVAQRVIVLAPCPVLTVRRR